jgi:hypothetical protein
MADYILEQCPHCSFPVGTNLGVHSELGPDVRECRRCGEVFGTGRSEWPDKRALGKMWYVGLSLAYALVAGLLGAICVRGAVHVWQNPGQSEMPLDGPGLVPGLVLGVAMVAGVQIFRVLASRKRAAGNVREVYRPPFFNLQVNLLPKCLGFLMLIPLLSWIARSIIPS